MRYWEWEKKWYLGSERNQSWVVWDKNIKAGDSKLNLI
jgi:hypothetical protein